MKMKINPNSKFDLDFVDRTLKTSGVVLLISLIFGVYYFGLNPALAFFFGGVWGMVNLLMLKRLVTLAIRPDGVDLPSVIILALIKFPLLYVAGFFLLKIEQFETIHLVYGFSSVLVVMVLKAAGRVLLGLDSENGNGPVQKVV